MVGVKVSTLGLWTKLSATGSAKLNLGSLATVTSLCGRASRVTVA